MISHFGGVPVINILIEFTPMKHITHVSHFGGVPTANVLIEVCAQEPPPVA